MLLLQCEVSSIAVNIFQIPKMQKMQKMKTSTHPDRLDQDLTFDKPNDNTTSLYQPPPRNRSHPAIASHLIAIAIAIVLLLRRPASIASAQTIACLCVLILMQHTNKHQASTTTHTRPLDLRPPRVLQKPFFTGPRSYDISCLDSGTPALHVSHPTH